MKLQIKRPERPPEPLSAVAGRSLFADALTGKCTPSIYVSYYSPLHILHAGRSGRFRGRYQANEYCKIENFVNDAKVFSMIGFHGHA